MLFKLSLYGLVAAGVFLVLMLLALQDSQWVRAATFGLLGAAFFIRHMPKLLVLRILDPYALLLLAGGVALFAWTTYNEFVVVEGVE